MHVHLFLMCLILVMIKFSISSFLQGGNSQISKKQQKHFYNLTTNLKNILKPLNQYEQLELPFQSSYDFMHFTPTSIKLSNQKHSLQVQFQKQKEQTQRIKQKNPYEQYKQSNFSILNDLRIPFPIQITQIAVLNEKFIFVFVFPDNVIIFQQKQNYITVLNTYKVQEMQKLNQQKSKNKQNNYYYPEYIIFFNLFDKYVIGYLQQTNDIFLFNQKGYTWLKNQAQITNLQHIQGFNSKKGFFFVAQRQKGFKMCKINILNKKIELVHMYTDSISIGFKTDDFNLSIYDISYNQQAQEVYLLDSNEGVILTTLFFDQQTQIMYFKSKSSSIIIKQPGCQALAYIHNDRFVLICEDRKLRYFIQAYLTNGKIIKKPAVFHNCNFQDLHITFNFYIAFQRSSIDIFWPSQENFIPELVHNKKHINLLGMQAFQIRAKQKDIYLYSIRNNILMKEKLEQQPYSFKIGSKQATKRTFTLQAYGNCQSLYKSTLQKANTVSVSLSEQSKNGLKYYIESDTYKKNSKVCQLKIPLNIEISKYIVEHRSKFSLAAGIIVICLLVSVTLICICLKKYIGMQNTAKQTLKRLKQTSTNPPQFVL